MINQNVVKHENDSTIYTCHPSGCNLRMSGQKEGKKHEYAKEAVKVETKAVLIKDTIQVTETKTVTETTVVKEAPEYLLVGGCFRIKDNADRMYEKLHKEGYANAMIMPYSRDLYLVAYEGYKTEKEAIAAVRKIHKIPGKEETWIYQIK